MTGKGKGKSSDAILTVGIKQGAGGTVAKAFGSNGNGRQQPKKKKQGKRGGRRPSTRCWDAFAPQHLPLPRAVAPYTVIRTSAIYHPDYENARRFALFGPMITDDHSGGAWTSGYALAAGGTMSSLRSANLNCLQYSFDSMSSPAWQAASVVPAAFSIQIMNPEALQTSSGMVYIGRCKNKVNLKDGDNSTSWEDLANNLVSYSNPRMCAAGKLALRGVQVDAVPNNMSELAKFTGLVELTDSSFTLSSSTQIHQEGFNPIFVYNPNAIDLQILVCCEWRVRFDPSNPAYAACVHHKPSTDTMWSDAMQSALEFGNGVVDIAEKVARIGVPLAKGAGMF